MQAVTTEPAVEQRTIQVLSEIFAGCPLERVAVRLWNGRPWPDERPRPATIVLKHPGALRRMFLPGSEIGLAEAYLYDDFDVEGDIEAAFDIADFLLTRVRDWRTKLRLASALLTLPSGEGSMLRAAAGRLLPDLRGRRHSRERDRRSVTFHYDLSNEFYRLWLDSRMVYSCAYFQSPADALDTAQERKLDYICRKLRLRPGQRLLDIGCGWGALVLHAARHYGVHALGISLSEPQVEWARAGITKAGLESRVSVQLRDYREITPDRDGPYDAVVSVGMAEHVGRERLKDYFTIAFDALKPGGVFLNHAIGEGVAASPANSSDSFIHRHVFPDGDIPPLPIVLKAAEPAGFEIRDVENLREHYALTLRHWVRRLEAHYIEARFLVDEATYRTWRLYMAGSAHSFAHGRIAVYQTLLAKVDREGNAHLPLTRNDWYHTAATT